MEEPRLTLKFEAHFENVDIARAALTGISDEYFGKDTESAADITIAVTEAMNNFVEHSGSASIELEVVRDEDELRVLVISAGTPFDPTVMAAGLDERGMLERDEGGYGLCLIRKLVDRFEYEYSDQHNIWKLAKFANH